MFEIEGIGGGQWGHNPARHPHHQGTAEQMEATYIALSHVINVTRMLP